jgi:hypothetical protein
VLLAGITASVLSSVPAPAAGAPIAPVPLSTGPAAVQPLVAGNIVYNEDFDASTTGTGRSSFNLPPTPSFPPTIAPGNKACLTSAAGVMSDRVVPNCASPPAGSTGRLELTPLSTPYFEGGVFANTGIPASTAFESTFDTVQYGGPAGAHGEGIAIVLTTTDATNPQFPTSLGQPAGGVGYALSYDAPSDNGPGMPDVYLGVTLDVDGANTIVWYSDWQCRDRGKSQNYKARWPNAIFIRGALEPTLTDCAQSQQMITPVIMGGDTSSVSTIVPADIVVNPTAVPVTMNGVSVPGGQFNIRVTQIGGTVRTALGRLPAIGPGRRLMVGWTAATGGVNTNNVDDYHDLDNVQIATNENSPLLQIGTQSYHGTTNAGDPVTYVLSPSVKNFAETQPVTVTQQLPAGVVPLSAYGAGWSCTVGSTLTNATVTCTNSNGLPIGAANPITVAATIKDGYTANQIENNTIAAISAPDAVSDTQTITGPQPVQGPSGIALTPNAGPPAGGNPVTISGTDLGTTTAINIGTSLELTDPDNPPPVTLVPCSGGATTGCFTVNGNGTVTIPSMPARASPAPPVPVLVEVVGLGISASATYTYVNATPPGPMTAPTATAGALSATVNWTAPADNGSAITGYTVTPLLGGVAQAPVTFGNTGTSQVVTGLTAGSSYTFTVAAINAGGTGPASPPSNVVIPFTVPGPPTITGVTAGSTEATLSWNPPASDGFSPITSYLVVPSVGGVEQTPQTCPATPTTCVITGLTGGASYRFTVAAVNAAGTGPPSAASGTIVVNPGPTLNNPPLPEGLINAPYSVQLTVQGGTSPFTWSISAGALPAGVTLSPTSGLISGTPAVLGTFDFTVMVTDANTKTATQALSLVVAEPFITLTDLTPQQLRITGVPLLTVTTTNAVTMNVNTNSPTGYQVTVQSSSAFLAPPAGNSARIPIGTLEVRQNDQGTYLPLSTSPTVIHSQNRPSAGNGDTIPSDFRITIPEVPPDAYATTLTYVASTL